MKELSIKCSSVRQLVLFIFILSGVIICCSASSTTEESLSSSTVTTLLESEDLYCSQESCQELRERVESLEEAFRAFVSALSNDDTNRHFATVSRKMNRNRAVQSLLLSSTSANIIQEEEILSTETASQSKPRKQNETSSVSSSVHHLKHAVKCSLAYMLDIHVAESHRANDSGGILNATLLRHHQKEENKSIEIEWSPPSAGCIEFVTRLWIRVYESGTDPAFKPYLSIHRKCLISKHHTSGRETLSILLTSSNSSSLDSSTNNNECNLLIDTLIDCRSYQVEVVPDFQSLRGKSIQAEVIIPPTMVTMTRLESLMSVSTQFDSLALSWEDNSGCASRLTSINLRLWPDGILPPKQGYTKLTTTIEPINYNIPRSCLEQVGRDGNLFSVTLSSNHSSSACSNFTWQSLDKCRKYMFEMESKYSSAWIGPSSSQTIFVALNQDSRYPTNPYFNSSLQSYWINCRGGEILCYRPPNYPYGHYNREEYVCRRYDHDICRSSDYKCLNPISQSNYIFDGEYCKESKDRRTTGLCLSGFKCGQDCIPKELLCDGKYDCLNGEDETIDHCDYMNSCHHMTSMNGTFPDIVTSGNNVNAFIKTKNLAKKYTLLISVNPDQVIWVDFEKQNNNNKTKVKVYDGPYSTSPEILSYDGSTKPSSVRSSGSNLYVEFFSYQNETFGIKAYYTTILKMEQYPFHIKGCGGYVNVLKDGGYVSSPNWNGDLVMSEYPDQCLWFIEARNEGETILLRKDDSTSLSDLSLLLPQIRNSPITVYDGWNASGLVLYDDNSVESKETIYSVSGKMLVRYYRPITRSNDTIENISWNVLTVFSPQCQQILTASAGIVTSPNYPLPYLKSSDCHWNITVASGSTIRFLFAVFQTQEKKDFVYVHDGPTVYHSLLMEKTGNVSTPFVINSSSNQVLVRFTSDVGLPFNGFLAVYSTV